MDTLVRDPFFTHMAPFFGLSFEQLIQEKHPTTWAEFECAQIGETELFARFFRDRRAIDGEGFKQHVRGAYRWIEGIEALLDELAAREVEMHLLSNYPEWYRLCDEHLGVSRWVQPTFVSCRTGVRKPSAEAYLGACRALGRAPEQCLFIDDRELNCSAARALGLDTHRFDGDLVGLRQALVERGLLA
jgi:HAD superfamily hydrolase (TIGR01509 family)